MATSNIYRVVYQIVKAGSGAGNRYVYRKELRTAHVSAASQGAVQGVLTSNLTLQSGETVEVVSMNQEATGDAVVYS